MPDIRTEITEIVTGLGMTGIDSLAAAVNARPALLHNVTSDHWDRLATALNSGQFDDDFASAWANGRAFLTSPDGLRDRLPKLIEWKGGHHQPGYDAIPADLRVDHVYLVSCKYQSRILSNSSPSNLFDRRLADRTAGAATESWYDICTPEEYQHFYTCVRRHIGLALLPPTPDKLTKTHIRRIRDSCAKVWPKPLQPLWSELSLAVATASAHRWKAQLQAAARQEEMLWRLLRISPSPYFVLGSSDDGPLQLRIGTPWDWRQTFALREFQISPIPAGQPTVMWSAYLTENDTETERHVAGHVEIRWSHGRFSSVEAKIYLDTPHPDVPGYFPLAGSLSSPVV